MKAKLFSGKPFIALPAVLLVFSLSLASCDTGINDIEVTDRKLDSIVLVEQPPGSNLCGVANVKMVEEYFFGSSNDWDFIFDQVSFISSQGNRVSSTAKMGNYLEKRDLYSSIIRFSNLQTILNYCEEYQIPAIMNIQSTGSPLLGHYVVFAGYDSDTGYVTIRDPANRNRTSIHYNDLQNAFTKVSNNAEIGGNIMILASDRLISERWFPCGNCGKRNVVDGAILEAIQHFGCNNCDTTWFPQDNGRSLSPLDNTEALPMQDAA